MTLIRLGLDPENERDEVYCSYCQKVNAHHYGCVRLIELTAQRMREQFAEEFEQIAYAERQARLYADAWDDAYCPEAIHWRNVVLILSGKSLSECE